VATGVVVGELRNERYIFKHSRYQFILDTSTSLSLGDEVYVVGWNHTISPSFFFTREPLPLPDIFKGKFEYEKWLHMK
jgi:hypothetical protein